MYIFFIKLPDPIYFFAGDPSGPDGPDGPKPFFGWKIRFFQPIGLSIRPRGDFDPLISMEGVLRPDSW